MIAMGFKSGLCLLVEALRPARSRAAAEAEAAAKLGSFTAHSSPRQNGRIGFSRTMEASAGLRGAPSLPTFSATSNASATVETLNQAAVREAVR